MNELLNSITASQLFCHLIGDYWLQTTWMAKQKRFSVSSCLAHACCYALPFWIITSDPLPLAGIGGAHYLVDRYALAQAVARLRGDDLKQVPPWCITVIDQSMHVLSNVVILTLS